MHFSWPFESIRLDSSHVHTSVAFFSLSIQAIIEHALSGGPSFIHGTFLAPDYSYN